MLRMLRSGATVIGRARRLVVKQAHVLQATATIHIFVFTALLYVCSYPDGRRPIACPVSPSVGCYRPDNQPDGFVSTAKTGDRLNGGGLLHCDNHSHIVTASPFLRALITINDSVVATNCCSNVCVCLERRAKHWIGLSIDDIRLFITDGCF